MGSVWDLPECQLRPDQDLQEAVKELLHHLGLDEATTAVYPDYFPCPIYMPPSDETTASVKKQEQGSAEGGGGLGVERTKERAELFVVVDNKVSLDTGGRAAVRWLDTKDIVAGWQEAAKAGAAAGAPAEQVDGTFDVGGYRVSDDVVGVLARMERIREMQKMDVLVDIKACREHFLFLQVMKELYERDGFPSDMFGGEGGGEEEPPGAAGEGASDA